jgi:phosphatidylinositol glycan class B
MLSPPARTGWAAVASALQRPGAAAAASALFAAAAAGLTRGRVHQDEIFQFLEPAHRLAFGFWMPAWEWTDGLRNWAVPGLLGGMFRLLGAAGARDPWALAGAAWIACAALQGLGTWALYRLVEERDGKGAACLAAWIHATWGGWLLYAARPLGDALSVAPLLLALWLGGRALELGRWDDGLRCGLWLGLAFVVRYPSAAFALPIGAALLWRRRWRALGASLAGGMVVLVALAVLDALTWGAPWHSARAYFSFNLLSGKPGAQFGREPWWWYLPVFAGMAPMLLAYHFVRGLRRADLAVATFATYSFIFELIGHKEPRFLVPLLPLFVAVAAGPAWRDLSRLWNRPRLLAAAGALYLGSSVAAATVQRPFGLRTDLVDATVAMGRDPELTGAIIDGPPPWNTGGRFYLGREVPLALTWGTPPAEVEAWLGDRTFSHVLVERGALAPEALARAGFTRWRCWDRVEVVRRTQGAGGRSSNAAMMAPAPASSAVGNPGGSGLSILRSSRFEPGATAARVPR